VRGLRRSVVRGRFRARLTAAIITAPARAPAPPYHFCSKGLFPGTGLLKRIAARLSLAFSNAPVEYGFVSNRLGARERHVSRRIQFGNALRGRRSRLILLALVLVVSVTPAFAHATRATRSTRVARSTRTARMTRRTSFVSTRRVGPENPHRTSAAHRSLWTPLFQPSRESMVIQNEEIDRLGLPRIQNEEQLEELVASGDLLPITPNQTLRIDPRLDPERRYCRPWTLDFVNDLSEAYFREFHDQIQINSAVRTVEVQERLRRYNSNAAPESGDLASSHLAGITVDIQRLGMTMAEIKWV